MKTPKVQITFEFRAYPATYSPRLSVSGSKGYRFDMWSVFACPTLQSAKAEIKRLRRIYKSVERYRDVEKRHAVEPYGIFEITKVTREAVS